MSQSQRSATPSAAETAASTVHDDTAQSAVSDSQFDILTPYGPFSTGSRRTGADIRPVEQSGRSTLPQKPSAETDNTAKPNTSGAAFKAVLDAKTPPRKSDAQVEPQATIAASAMRTLAYIADYAGSLPESMLKSDKDSTPPHW